MPIRIVATPDDPNNSRTVEYFPDQRDARQRPAGSYTFDASGRQFRRPETLRGDAPLDREFVVGLDLGQSNDFSAIAAVERLPNGYAVPLLARTRGRPYPEIVGRVADLMAMPPLAGQAELVIDGTGIGRPVLDIFRASGLDPRTITITGGAKAQGSLRHARVPRRDLINSVLLAMQAGHIVIAQDQTHAATLAHELAELRLKVTASGHDRYEPRKGGHDDMIVALGMAVWTLERSLSRLRPAAS